MNDGGAFANRGRDENDVAGVGKTVGGKKLGQNEKLCSGRCWNCGRAFFRGRLFMTGAVLIHGARQKKPYNSLEVL